MRFLGVLFILFLATTGNSQQKLLPLNQQFNTWEEANFNRIDNEVHTSIRPILESDFNYDSLKTERDKYICRAERTKWLGRKLKSEHFIRVNQDDFNFTIDPVINMEYGIEQSQLPDTTTLYKNTRGILVQGDIGKHVSFSTSFYESQAYFPSYVDSYTREINTDPVYPTFGIVPGQGRAKSFKNGGFDYGMSSANVSYSPNSYLNVQLGYGKNFIGEGYRSMLLSDVAFNYPFIKITSKFGKKKKWQYSNIYSSLKHIDRVPTTIATEQQYIPKGGSFHYLSWSPNGRIQIGFFEGTIVETWDADSSVSVPISVMEANPIIGINSLSFGTNGNNNTVLGINLKITPISFITIYGQYVYDYENQYGYQTGLKVYNFGGLVKNLSLRLEYNSAMPFAYSHNQPIQNYGHYGQPLAHPYGAGFNEALAILNYNFKDVFVQAKYITAKYTDDEGVYNWGTNIFKASSSASTEQIIPDESTLSYMDFQLGYMVNPNYNMNIVLGATLRNLESTNIDTQARSSTYVYFAFRTSLRNLYYDF
ncbi:MAG: hypothetical protein JKY42_01730 [Flavobacteriales bacterium]|nr:hypothetical protein [Flavobacteriales bacterium]